MSTVLSPKASSRHTVSANKPHSMGRRSLIYPSRDVLWMLPGLFIFAVCYLLPYGSSILSSFEKSGADRAFVGFENYQALFSDHYFWMAYRNTFVFSFVALMIVLSLAILIAHGIFSLHRGEFALVLLLVPFFLPSASVAALWRGLFGSQSVFAQFPYINDSTWKTISLYLLFVWKNLGIITALLFVGLKRIDPSILDACKLDGAGSFRLLRSIEIPMLRKTLLFALLYLTMNVLRIFRESYLLYGGYPPRNLLMIQNYVYQYFIRLDYSLLSSAATVFSHTVLLLFSVLFFSARPRDAE